MTNQIKRIYTRHYSDNGQTKAYVEWSGGARTESPAMDYHGVYIPCGPCAAHMAALFERGKSLGLTATHETW